eukprot:6206087-Pleurochrysis_carterae.AAC.2
MISNGIGTSAPERAIIIVSKRLNNDSYRLDRGQGWKPQVWPGLIGIVHWHHLSKVCISPIQRVPMYDVSSSANLYFTPSDGFSTHDAHLDGCGYNSAPHSFIFLMTPEYEPPAFNYSNGLCYIPP